MEEEEDLDLAERVDTMRRTQSAIQYLGPKNVGYDQNASDSSFNITQFIERKSQQKKIRTNSEMKTSAIFTSKNKNADSNELLFKIQEEDEFSGKSDK